MTPLLCALFFVSGAAALVFETLWFRQASLAFGNSVWASSLVLASFMAGLALGNGVAARIGSRVRDPLRAYAALEVAIAVSGVALVFGLPHATPLFAAALGPWVESPWLVNPLRLLAGFALLLVPSTAMGATLPLMVKTLVMRRASFGTALGALYGWNTLGAVLGALAGEIVLIERLGVRGSALAAGGADLAVALAVTALARSLARKAESAGASAASQPPARASAALGGRALRLLGAAFLCGLVLLALETVWFRFLQLFIHASSLAFSVMLAVVLAGIGAGGILAGAVLRRDPDVPRFAPACAIAAGCLVCALYAGFALVLAPYERTLVLDALPLAALAGALAFPVAVLSGVLFTWTGAALRRELAPDTRAAGWLTLANTIGSGLGSLLGGFVLLPLLGMERSFALLAAVYGVVALLLAGAVRADGAAPRRALRLAGAGALAAALVLFPYGLMARHYLELPVRRMAPGGGLEVAAVREGITETILYLRSTLFGEPLDYHLFTNGFAMSGTHYAARRYMKLYVYWPVALRPDPKRALLISYGVGSTAKALTETASLERIDVVDISREILELGAIVFPDPAQHPLRDPRVHVHVEDGRWFLETTRERYDLITGEPPPPKNAGVVNLYTREYFALVRERLAEGGIHTYWLPVHNLTEPDAQAIVRAYCDVFDDCSLWGGRGFDWMLVGSRGARWTRSEEAFARQWRDPRLAAELRAVGLEQPEQLGALFMAGPEDLRAWTAGAAPLVDDFPKRLSDRAPRLPAVRAVFAPWLDVAKARERFVASPLVGAAWPPALRERTLAWFDLQRIVNEVTAPALAQGGVYAHMRDLHRSVAGSSLRSLPLWLLGTSDDELAIVAGRVARGEPRAECAPWLAADALAAGDYARAADLYGDAARAAPRDRAVAYRHLYALALAGRSADAIAAARSARAWLPRDAEDAGYWRFLAETFGLKP
jgi:spermidine synthase